MPAALSRTVSQDFSSKTHKTPLSDRNGSITARIVFVMLGRPYRMIRPAVFVCKRSMFLLFFPVIFLFVFRVCVQAGDLLKATCVWLLDVQL